MHAPMPAAASQSATNAGELRSVSRMRSPGSMPRARNPPCTARTTPSKALYVHAVVAPSDPSQTRKTSSGTAATAWRQRPAKVVRVWVTS